MFTGVVQALGTVVGVEPAPRPHGPGGLAHRFDLDLGALAAGLQLGASVAVNGVCLTLAERRGTVGVFHVVPETWQRSTLGSLRRGDAVHLENTLRVGDALDGHFVQGHVDGTGHLERIERRAGEWKLWIQAPVELVRYIVPKGSIAIDGTSLTIVDATGELFSVALIPTTLERTTFARRQPGDRVNLETDILARLIVARLDALAADGSTGGRLTWEQLQAGGFAP
jgi:riboflavin synthase